MSAERTAIDQIMNLVSEQIDQSLGEQVGCHLSFDLPEGRTEEYREGYVDGLKQAMAVLKEIYEVK